MRLSPCPSCSGPASAGALQRPLPVRLVSFNVRYATPSPVAGEQSWCVRCPRLCAQLCFVTTGHDAAFLCLQEVLHAQVLDIHFQLGRDEWAYIGHGRDDGKKAGEYAPIFYRPHVWHCRHSRVYWLSETPDRPSRGWDASLNRIVTVGCFEHRGTGQTVVVMSTHFDHLGVLAREKSAGLILRIADVWRHGGPDNGDIGDTGSGDSKSDQAVVPVFLGGDFHSTPDEEAYKTLTATPGGMLDILGMVPWARQFGNGHLTYTSFGEPDETPRRIDYLFVSEAASLRFKTFAILANRFDDSIFLSDHRAVVADVEVLIAAGDSRD